MKNKYINNVALLDFIFLLLAAVSTLFIILLAILKTEASPPAVKDRNQFVVIMEWTHTSMVDIDMWILGPAGNVASYQRKESNGLFLQRDDLGGSNDWVTDGDGVKRFVPLNQEIVNIRQFVPGRYHINAHAYSLGGKGTFPVDVSITLIKVTPFQEFNPVVHTMTDVGQEKAFITMDINEFGEIELMPAINKTFILDWKAANPVGNNNRLQPQISTPSIPPEMRY